MEVIVVVGVAGVILAVLIVGLGSVLNRSRSTDELESERGAGRKSAGEGMADQPVRDRPAGPDAEPQHPDTVSGELHPREQQGDTDDAAMPSEAAGKWERNPDDERR